MHQIRCYSSLEASCKLNYTPFGVFRGLPQFKETVEPVTLSHWFILHPMRYFASYKAITISSYTCFGYWGHFHILEKLGLSLGRVFSAIWGVMALWSKLTGHSVRCRDPSSPSPALGQKLIAQMQWLTLGEWDCLLDSSQKLVMGQPNSR